MKNKKDPLNTKKEANVFNKNEEGGLPEHTCSVTINIERIQKSIDSGFKTIPDGLTEDEIMALIWKK